MNIATGTDNSGLKKRITAGRVIMMIKIISINSMLQI
jgi:hypothetical protein